MSPCNTCAFGKSGGAADEPNNRLKGLIAARSGIPFFCHHGKDGVEYERNSSLNPLGPLILPPANRKLCEGWRQAVSKLKARGLFDFGATNPEDAAMLRRYQRRLGQDALVTLNELLNSVDPAEREDLREELDGRVRAVMGISE